MTTSDGRTPWWDRAGLQPDRLIYATITLMSILIVYDGWTALSFGGVVAVIVGPLLAIFLGHIYGGALGVRVELGRPLTNRERRDLLSEEAGFLLVGVPPLVILFVLWLAGTSYTRIIQVIVLVGVLSLGFWGAVAGRRAGLRGWSFVASIASGLAIGAVILVLQTLLRPGHGTLRH